MSDGGNIQYSMDLSSDNFVRNMRNAEGAAMALEERLKSIGSFGTKLLAFAGIALTLDKAFEFIKDATSEARDATIQMGLLNQQLKNVGKFSDDNVESLKNMREEMSKMGFYNPVENIKFQRDMIQKYSGSNEAGKELYTKAALDLAAAKGVGSEEGGHLLDRLINLRVSRTGKFSTSLNKFAQETGMPELLKHFKDIQNASKSSDPSALLAKVVEETYKGMAQAKVANDPDAQYNQELQKLKDDVGSLGIEFEKKLMPMMKEFVAWLDDIVTNHFDEIKDATDKFVSVIKFVSEHIEAIGIVIAIKEAADAFSWIANLFKTTGLTMSAVTTINAATVIVNGASNIGNSSVGNMAAEEEGEVAAGGVGAGEVAALGSAPTMIGGAIMVAIAASSIYELVQGIKGSDKPTNHWYKEQLFQTDWQAKMYGSKRDVENAGYSEEQENKQLKLRLEDMGYKPNDAQIQKLNESYKLAGETETPFEKLLSIYGKDKYIPSTDEINKNILGLHAALVDNVKETKKNTKVSDKPVIGGGVSKSQVADTTVKGIKPTNIYITINDGLVKTININSTGLGDTHDKIVATVTEGLVEALNASQGIAASRTS